MTVVIKLTVTALQKCSLGEVIRMSKKNLVYTNFVILVMIEDAINKSLKNCILVPKIMQSSLSLE